MNYDSERFVLMRDMLSRTPRTVEHLERLIAEHTDGRLNMTVRISQLTKRLMLAAEYYHADKAEEYKESANNLDLRILDNLAWFTLTANKEIVETQRRMLGC